MKKYLNVTPEIKTLTEKCINNSNIDPELYKVHEVKKGLRDLDGKGVVAGLTEISTIISSEEKDGVTRSCKGRLYYRGINVEDIVKGFTDEGRFGFEETVYLLLFGELPNTSELEEFNKLLVSRRTLPTNFNRDVIMKAPNSDIMNSLARSVLTLYSYDKSANDISVENVMGQCINLISVFPMLSVYAYQAYRHYGLGKEFSSLEAKLLDMALVLHAEHGGGNNSTFTTHVVTSSGTDTYSSTAASLCSLKGPKHGGANIKVKKMFEDIKKNVRHWNSDSEIRDYLTKILEKKAFDNAGLIYGMGHAVYSLSDPRAEIFKAFVGPLSKEKGREDEFELYKTVARLATEVIGEKRKIYKGVSPNVDFYSGFVYSMLDIPDELYTPLFAISRIAGWSAHRLEEIINAGKIIRPAYKSVAEEKEYVRLGER